MICPGTAYLPEKLTQGVLTDNKGVTTINFLTAGQPVVYLLQ